MVAYAYYFTDARIKAYVKSLLNKGFDVDVLSLKEPGKQSFYERIGNLTIYYLSHKYHGKSKLNYVFSYLKFITIAFVKLSILQSKKHYRLVHVHNMPNFIILSTVLPKLCGTKIILDMHDLMSKTYAEKFGNNKALSKLVQLEEKVSCRFADRVICADEFQRSFLTEERIVPPNKIQVIMNLPDMGLFKQNNNQGQNIKCFNIIHHGTITYRLGIDIILKAIAMIKDSIPVKFFLYGSGDHLNKCLEIVNQNELQDIVVASKRFFQVEELPGLLVDKHLGIIGNRQSSATRYMLPVKMLEYMAMGIPVIAPALDNIKYYLQGDQVCFYEPEDVDDLAGKIVYLYRHPETRETFSKNAFRYIERHNWHTEERKYINIVAKYGNKGN